MSHQNASTLFARCFGIAGLVGLGLYASACTLEPPDKIREPFTPPPASAPYVPAPKAETRKFVILHTNDEHSHLLAVGPASEYPFLPVLNGDGSFNETATVAAVAARIGTDTKTVGGIARRQYLINKVRSESADPVLLLSAGDVMMGSIFHMATTEGAPDYLAMALLGYDFVTLGNHEFDWGPDSLAESIHVASNFTFGAPVPIISSNIHFDDVVAGDTGDALQKLYGDGNGGAKIAPWATKVLPNGLKVGFVGLTGYNATVVAPAMAPVFFSAPRTGAACSASNKCASATDDCLGGYCVDPLDAPGHLQAMAQDVQPIVDLLRDQEKVDLVVAMTHLGSQEDMPLAQLTHGIDIIIGGHGHEEIAPTVIPSQVGSGQTIIVQAGSYGRRLGQLTVTVAPDGTVDYVAAETKLIAVDDTLDAAIYEGTDLLASPAVLSPAFEHAIGLTGAVIAPTLAGLNSNFATLLGAFGKTSFLDKLVTSDHDVIGQVHFKDHNLLHLITDSMLGTVVAGACLDQSTDYVVAVEANGVARESLRFGTSSTGLPHTTTVADAFGVVPLGASPYEFSDETVSYAVPGFPLVMFKLAAAELFAGIEVGVSQGLVADDFFLSYAGMRVTYDPTLPAFDSDTFNPASNAAGGRTTKIEILHGPGYQTVYSLDTTQPPASWPVWAARWQNITANTLITVITNLYDGGFLLKLGLHPIKTDGVTPITEDTLYDMVLCQVGAAPACPGTKAIGLCGVPKWKLFEVKEWTTLVQYLATLAAGGGIGSSQYAGDLPAKADLRVIDATAP